MIFLKDEDYLSTPPPKKKIKDRVSNVFPLKHEIPIKKRSPRETEFLSPILDDTVD